MSSSTVGQRHCETMLDMTHANLAYLDRDFNILRVNSAFAETARKAPEEVIGRNHLALFPNEQTARIFRRVRDSGEPFEEKARPFEFQDQPDKGVTYWDWTLTPVKSEAGEVEALVFSATEVTDEVRTLQRLEESERARGEETRLLETILSSIESCVLYLDGDFNVLDINSPVVQTLSLTESQILGANIFDLADIEVARRRFVSVRDTGETESAKEQPVRLQPDAEVSYWDWTMKAVKDEEGEVVGLVLSAAEVTEKVKQREKLLEVERSRRRFAETMAAEINHRMKNNLTMLAGLIRLQARERDLDEATIEIIDTAAARISSIAAVHEELYERRRPAANVVDLLRRMARANAEAVGAEGVELVVEGDDFDCGPKAATSLTIVASELVLNGLKHGGPDADGRHRIRIRTSRSADTLTLTVWNSGNPVPLDFDRANMSKMGLKLIEEVVEQQFDGHTSLRPEGSGTMAEVILSEGKLREMEEVEEQ